MIFYYVWLVILLVGIIFELFNLSKAKNKTSSTWMWIIFFIFGLLLTVNRFSNQPRLDDSTYANKSFLKLLR